MEKSRQTWIGIFLILSGMLPVNLLIWKPGAGITRKEMMKMTVV